MSVDRWRWLTRLTRLAAAGRNGLPRTEVLERSAYTKPRQRTAAPLRRLLPDLLGFQLGHLLQQLRCQSGLHRPCPVALFCDPAQLIGIGCAADHPTGLLNLKRLFSCGVEP